VATSFAAFRRNAASAFFLFSVFLASPATAATSDPLGASLVFFQRAPQPSFFKRFSAEDDESCSTAPGSTR
jgi:hypothetical protein